MAERRHHQRIDCVEKCLLYYTDSRYSGAVMNISISGALVHFSGSPPGGIMPGDACSLILSTDPVNYSCRYKGRIARVNLVGVGVGVGVEILEHEF